jgi:hypothetical protein
MNVLQFFLGPDTLENKMLLLTLVLELGTMGLIAAQIMEPLALLLAWPGGFLLLAAPKLFPLMIQFWLKSQADNRAEDEVPEYDPGWRKAS